MHSPGTVQERGGGQSASEVDVLVQGYSNHMRALQKAPRTVEEYCRDIKAWAGWWSGTVHTFDTNGWDQYLYYLTETRHVTGVTIRRYQGALKSFYRYLRRKRIVSHDPAMDAEKVGTVRRLPMFLTEAEIALMYQACATARETAIMELLYGCGLRNSELRELKTVSISSTHVRVFGKGQKERIVPITPKTFGILQAHIGDRRGYAIANEDGTMLTHRRLHTIVRRIGKVTGKRVRPHGLRHSIATHLRQRGVQPDIIQQFLGHVSIQTTMIYTHLAQTDLSKAILSNHPSSCRV